MKKKNILQKLSSGKGFYLTAAVSFVLIIAAIAFVYNSSVNLIRDLDIPTTTEEATKKVQKNEEDIADPRTETTTADIRERETTAATSRTAEKETESQTVTAEEVIESQSFVNTSYVFPFGNEIGKEYSLTPVYDETMGDWRIHAAIDFLGEKGSDVVSVGDGRVTKVIADPSRGYCIEVDHGEFTARYCGIEQGTAVGIDDEVKKGDLIGKLGDIPCESAQESHLHFETLTDGVSIDPIKALGK